MKTENLKVKDTGKDISSRSRMDQYWMQRGFLHYFKAMRSPKPALKGNETVQELYQMIVSDYGFVGVEFGNWVNNESRFNYMVSAIVALQDLQTVLKFPNSNTGINKVGLAFGARGQGRAAAHFEPGTFIINMTRYSRGEDFDLSGGVGALAHEYGHALDYYFGTFHAKNWQYRSLTFGRLTTTRFEDMPPATTMQGLACRIVYTMIWKSETRNEKTAYYERLKKKVGDVEYWFRHNEFFARAFEQFIQYKLEKKNIKNKFLTQRKYENAAYLDPALLKKVVPLFDRLITMMRTKV